MPGPNTHVPGQGPNDAQDAFYRVYQAGVLPAAAATYLFNAHPLPVAAAVLDPAVTPAAIPAVVYAQRGPTVTSLLSDGSASGGFNTRYQGQSMWKLPKPMKLQLVCSGAQAGNVTIIGLDRWGSYTTETLALNGATIVNSAKAYEYILFIDLPIKVAAETVSIGTLAVFELPWRAINADAIFLEYADAAKDTAGTLSVGSATSGVGLWAPHTAPNGVHTYELHYFSID